MTSTAETLTAIAEHLEAAAALTRQLALGLPEAVDTAAPGEEHPLEQESITPEEWVNHARDLHPALGERQAQVLGEVAKAHPHGIGTGPICRSIGYEQTNTYLALDALGRQGLVRKDDTAKPHQYYLGKALLRQGRGKYSDSAFDA